MRFLTCRVLAIGTLFTGMVLVVVSSGMIAEADCDAFSVQPARCIPAVETPYIPSIGGCYSFFYMCRENVPGSCYGYGGVGWVTDGWCQYYIQGGTSQQFVCIEDHFENTLAVHEYTTACAYDQYGYCNCVAQQVPNINYWQTVCDCM